MEEVAAVRCHELATAVVAGGSGRDLARGVTVAVAVGPAAVMRGGRDPRGGVMGARRSKDEGCAALEGLVVK